MENTPVGKRKLSHSQNFLRSPNFVRSLINKTDLKTGDFVLEIGSGKGIITKLLAEKGCQVVGLELDNHLFTNLLKQFEQYPNVKVVKADFLKWNLPQKPYKVFSNIPFNITADIITKLLVSGNPPTVAYLILQDKAAERFIGEPFAKNTQTSILLKPLFEAEIISRINKRQFIPSPNIDAVLVMFRKRQTPLIEEQFIQLFRDFVVYGYSQWKPTVLEAFAKVFSSKQRLILEKEIDISGLKPRDLKIKQWIFLFKSFLSYVPEHKKELVRGSEKRLKDKQRRLEKWHRTR
jgi:23S rRNA (adenine-N6)-dimethyltransferase